MNESNIQTVLNIFRAIEEREPDSRNMEPLLELCQPDVELSWPPSLPYGGTSRGFQITGPSWSDFWDPLQPTPAYRRMDPRVVAANGRNKVVVAYRQRGVNHRGERFETEVIGLYQMRDQKLLRAQMFYFDEAGTNRFVAVSMRQGV